MFLVSNGTIADQKHVLIFTQPADDFASLGVTTFTGTVMREYVSHIFTCRVAFGWFYPYPSGLLLAVRQSCDSSSGSKSYPKSISKKSHESTVYCWYKCDKQSKIKPSADFMSHIVITRRVEFHFALMEVMNSERFYILLVISQYWIREWHCGIRQQAESMFVKNLDVICCHYTTISSALICHLFVAKALFIPSVT